MPGALTSHTSQPVAARLAVIPPSAATGDLGDLVLRDTLLLEQVHFVHDRSDITPTAVAILDELAEWLRTHPDVRVTIAGHAESVGAFAYNSLLSARRARAVRDHLFQRGVPEFRMAVVSQDAGLPFAAQAKVDVRTPNRRRVELPVRGGDARTETETRTPRDAERRAHPHPRPLHPKV